QVSKANAAGTRNESLVSKLNDGAAISITEAPESTYYKVGDRMFVKTYARVLVRNLHPGKEW
ncbi:MAG: hypothetical protein DI613_22215, partial [Kocuria rhizophila]